MKNKHKNIILAVVLAAALGIGSTAFAFTPPQSCSGNQFFNSLSSGGTYGCGTPSSTATTSINGTQALSFSIIGDGSGVTTTVNGAITTISLITTGNWSGLWQGNNPSAFYLSSNPNHYVSTSTTDGLYYPLSSNPNGYLTSLAGALLAANNLSDLQSTSTARINLGLGSIATHPSTDYLPSSTPYVSTFNGASGAVTGVSSFNGATGTVTYAPSTTIPTTYVTSFNGASGVVTYAPSTTIPTNNNQLMNGAGCVTSTVKTVGWVFGNTTTTQPYGEFTVPNATARTITKFECGDVGPGTSTLYSWYDLSPTSTSLGSGTMVLSSAVCSTWNAVTSFSTTSIPANSYLHTAVSSSIIGAPTQTTVFITATAIQ